MYDDVNNNGKIDANDRVILGASTPNFKLNMSNTLRYKNFQLYVMIAGSFGGGGFFQQGNRNAYLTGGARDYFGANGLYVPFWTEENPSSVYPRARYDGDTYFLGLQSRGFVRLQDVTFSYTFNQPWVKRAGISRMQAFVSGKNLATITNWVGGDPETGGSYNGNPVATTITLGLNLSF